MEDWLLLAIIAIMMYGSSMAAQKLALGGMSSASMILFSLLIALPMFLAVLVWIILTGEIWTIGADSLAYAIIGATFGQAGYYTYVEAAKRGPISIVASLTATYPAMVAVVAIVFLGEMITPVQGGGVVLVMAGIVTLSYFHGRSAEKKAASKGYYVICIVTVFIWGLWAIFAKLALIGMSNIAFLSIYSLIIPPVTLAYYRLSRIRIRDVWPKWGTAVKIAIVSSVVGNLAYFVEVTAIDSGPAPVVFPLIASSPLVVILLAFAFLKERLSKIEWTMVALVVIGIILVSTQ